MKIQVYKVVLLCFFILSCSKENQDECSSVANAPTLEVEGAVTTTINQPVELLVTYQVNTDCGNFRNFAEETFGNETQIIVKALFTGCACEEELINKTTTYTFNKSQVGTYVLKFRTFNNFIEHTIEVTN
jgi:hypothetical protein